MVKTCLKYVETARSSTIPGRLGWFGMDGDAFEAFEAFGHGPQLPQCLDFGPRAIQDMRPGKMSTSLHFTKNNNNIII